MDKRTIISELLFRCTHQHTTFPLTPVKRAVPQQTYVVCLDCGKEFAYDWGRMCIGGEQAKTAPAEETA